MATRAVYGRDSEWQEWLEAAEPEPVNTWIRRALNEQAQLDRALRELAERDGDNESKEE